MARDVSPDDAFPDGVSDWIESGKEIPFAVDVLLEIVNDPQSERRRTAASVIGHFHDERVSDTLKNLVDTNDGRLLFAAVQSLRVLADDKAVNVLGHFLDWTYRQPDSAKVASVRDRAILRANILEALEAIGGNNAMSMFEAAMEKETDPLVLKSLRP